MKKVFYIVLLVLPIVINSCSNLDDMENGLTYSNDFDQMIGWIPNNSLVKGNAHSGNYMCKIDSTLPYFFTFVLSPDNFPTKTAKTISASVWGKVINSADTISLIIEFSSNGKFLGYIGKYFSETCKNADEWNKVEVSLDIPQNLPPDALLKVYVWSPQKRIPTYFIDDFEVSFVD